MKTVVFRPLRRIKKTGKITVTSYMQWRKVKTSDYNKFTLTIKGSYIDFDYNEYVYDHKGNLLYWRDYNPSDIPIFTYTQVDELFNLDEIRKNHKYGIVWTAGSHINYSAIGLDCDGVPTFSHYTEEYITSGNNFKLESVSEFEPLTVGMVVKWFGWFVYQLQNNRLLYK